MARKVSERGAGDSHPDGAGSSEADEQGNKRPNLGRRALLTRGGVVAAGVVGVGAVAGAAAGPASAQATTAVDMNTANDAGTNLSQPTELDADNSTAPAFILKNTGVDTTNQGSGPNLRLTPSTATGDEPTLSTVGGDLTATADGQLWFTHDFTTASGPEIVSAPVHTEATANVYAGLLTPVRVLDTRSASLRTNIINPSGNLNSKGQLESGKTIYINLDNQVIYADNVIANLTVTATTVSGFLTLWSGYPATPPNISTINWVGANVTLSNFCSGSVGVYPAGSTSPTYDNVIAIYAKGTTHVLLDVVAFTMPGFEYSKVSADTVASRSARLQRAQQAIRNARGA
jgi:hypothetical protein